MRSRIARPASLAERITGVTCCVLIALGLSNCQRTATAPDELIGYWTTSAPGYKDRYLHITKSTIVFGTGSGTGDAQPIRKIEAIQEGSRILYTMVYGLERKDEESLSFYYDPGERVITFRNQSHLLWKKMPGT
jgi:hypothetical protein